MPLLLPPAHMKFLRTTGAEIVNGQSVQQHLVALDLLQQREDSTGCQRLGPTQLAQVLAGVIV